MSAWPFDLWMKYAVRALGLSPEQFWSVTIADWLCLMPKSASGMTRGALTNLMGLYPDEKNND